MKTAELRGLDGGVRLPDRSFPAVVSSASPRHLRLQLLPHDSRLSTSVYLSFTSCTSSKIDLGQMNAVGLQPVQAERDARRWRGSCPALCRAG